MWDQWASGCKARPERVPTLTPGKPTVKPATMSRILARRLQVGLVLAAVSLVAPAVIADSKVAVVDTQRAVMETEDGLRMQASLKKIFDQRQQELDQKQNDLQREREELDKQRGVLSQQALQERAEKWQAEMMQVQQRFVQYNKELQSKQNELMQPILAKALDVVRRIATEQGYAVVVDKQAVPYAREDLDLTDRVIQGYNSAPAQPAAGAPATPARAAAKPAASK